MKIPNVMTCHWCNGSLIRRGTTHLGSGTNSFTMFCNSCGSVAHFAHNSSFKIGGLEVRHILENPITDGLNARGIYTEEVIV